MCRKKIVEDQTLTKKHRSKTQRTGRKRNGRVENATFGSKKYLQREGARQHETGRRKHSFPQQGYKLPVSDDLQPFLRDAPLGVWINNRRRRGTLPHRAQELIAVYNHRERPSTGEGKKVAIRARQTDGDAWQVFEDASAAAEACRRAVLYTVSEAPCIHGFGLRVWSSIFFSTQKPLLSTRPFHFRHKSRYVRPDRFIFDQFIVHFCQSDFFFINR